MTPLTGFIGGAYSLPSKNAADQLCVNLFVEQVETQDKAPAILIGTPGQVTHVALSNSGTSYDALTPRIGGAFTAANGRMFVLIGWFLNEISPFTWDATHTGFANGVGGLCATMSSTGPVSISDNVNGIMIVDGTVGGYWFVPFLTGIVAHISDAALTTGATHISYLDSRFIINDMGTNRFRASPLDWDGATPWDPLAYASADQSPDLIQGLTVTGRDIWIPNQQTMELWYDAGLSPFPFARNTSVAFQIGIYAKYSLCQAAGSIFWLGAGAEGFGIIYKSNGYSPQRISNFGIEREIRGYSSIDDAFGMIYQERGHLFYAITFQSGNVTWCYDLSTGAWHQRGSLNEVTGKIEKWRAVAVTSFNGKIFVVDPKTRQVYSPFNLDTALRTCINELSLDVYDECGVAIQRLRTSPHSFSNMNRVFFSRFQLDMETGVGLTTGQGSNPLMRLRYSNDAGHTWSNFLLRSFGAIGQYFKRVIWDRLGQSRSRVWEVSTSEPVPIRILGAWVEAEEGGN